MLVGQEQPDSGELIVGKTVRTMYVDQSREALDSERSVASSIAKVDIACMSGHVTHEHPCTSLDQHAWAWLTKVYDSLGVGPVICARQAYKHRYVLVLVPACNFSPSFSSASLPSPAPTPALPLPLPSCPSPLLPSATPALALALALIAALALALALASCLPFLSSPRTTSSFAFSAVTPVLLIAGA